MRIAIKGRQSEIAHFQSEQGFLDDNIVVNRVSAGEHDALRYRDCFRCLLGKTVFTRRCHIFDEIFHNRLSGDACVIHKWRHRRKIKIPRMAGGKLHKNHTDRYVDIVSKFLIQSTNTEILSTCVLRKSNLINIAADSEWHLSTICQKLRFLHLLKYFFFFFSLF